MQYGGSVSSWVSCRMHLCVREATSGQLQRCAQWPFALPVQAFFPTRTAEKLRNGIYSRSGLISWLCIKQSNDPKLTSCPAYNRRAHVFLMLLSFPLPFPACSALQSAGYSSQRTWAAPGPCAESHCSTTGNFLLHGAPV